MSGRKLFKDVIKIDPPVRCCMLTML